MKWAKQLLKKILLYGSLTMTSIIILIAIFVYVWQNTDEGKLPAKTAVVLHAINNNLVNLDINIRLPKFITGSGSGNKLIREDLVILMDDHGEIPLRMYRPDGKGPYPIIMYYHGGAFMKGYGSIDTHDNIVRSLAARTKSVVIAVGYRVAPEYIFPTAIEDSYAALNWAVEHADSFHGDVEKISVVGDSAGGNIATVVSLMSRDRKGPEILSQVLLYPLTTFLDIELESRNVYDNGYYLLSRSVMYRARELYTPDEEMWSSPYTSPLHAEDLSDLPATLIITAEFDPLRDEGEAYADRLFQFGVPVKASRYEGVMHGFISFYEVMKSGQYGLQEVTSFLNRAHSNKLNLDDPYELQVKQSPEGLDKVRDQTEAYAIAAYLIGKSSINKLKQ